MSASPPPGAARAPGCPCCPGTGRVPQRDGARLWPPAPLLPARAAPRGPLACRCDLGCVRLGFAGRWPRCRAGAGLCPSLGGRRPAVLPLSAAACPEGSARASSTSGERGPGCHGLPHPLTLLLLSPTPAEDAREKAGRKALEAGECLGVRGPTAGGGLGSAGPPTRADRLLSVLQTQPPSRTATSTPRVPSRARRPPRARPTSRPPRCCTPSSGSTSSPSSSSPRSRCPGRRRVLGPRSPG